MIYDYRSDINPSKDVVVRYAMPNIHARYTRDDIAATKWDGDYPVCAVCGRSRGNFAVHHEPTRNDGLLKLHAEKALSEMRSEPLLLKTDMGRFVVKPALLLLCEECHGDRHDRRLLKIDWRFDTQEDERKWLEGWFYAHGYAEHDTRMFEHGAIVIEHRGKSWEVRG